MARDRYDESKDNKKKEEEKKAAAKPQSSSGSKPKSTPKLPDFSHSTFMGGGASVKAVEKAASKPKTSSKSSSGSKPSSSSSNPKSTPKLPDFSHSTFMGGGASVKAVEKTVSTRRGSTPRVTPTRIREREQRRRAAQNQKMTAGVDNSAAAKEERRAKRTERRTMAQAMKSGDYDRAATLRGEAKPGTRRAKIEEWDKDIADTVTSTIKQSLAADARVANLSMKGITQKDAFMYTTKEQRDKADKKVEARDKKLGKAIEKETSVMQGIQDKHGYVGKQALSAVSSATGMGMDIAAGAIIPGSSLFHMWTRSTGTSLGEVNKKADNLRNQLKQTGQYTDDELDEMFRNVDALDMANAAASGGIEVLSELLFPGIGAARKVIGGKGMSIAERAGAKLFNKAGARATGGLLRSMTRGTLEEVAEEEIGGPLQAMSSNTIYGNKFQRYNEDAIKRSLASESNALRSNIRSEADAQATAARLSSQAFMDESVNSYLQSGYSKKESTKLAELSRKYLTASLTGDVDAMKKYQDEMVKIMAGGENSQKQKFSLQDAIDAAVSTSMMTMVTGAPTALSTMQIGNSFKENNGLNAVKQQAEIIKNWSSDPKDKAKAQAVIDHIDRGGDLSGTQVYEIIQKTGELAEESKQPEAIKNRTAQVEMNRRDLRISPVNADGSLAPQTQQRYEQIVSDTVSRHATLARLSNSNASEDFVGPSARFAQRNANTETEDMADVYIGANIGAAFKVGAINSEMVNELARGSETVKSVFREVTGINVRQFSSYSEMNEAIMSEAADNMVNSARLEQIAWNDETRKQASDALSKGLGSKGDLAVQGALESVDPRDRTQFMMTADVARNLYDFARHTEGTWNEAKSRYKGMYPAVDMNVLRNVFDAAKADKEIAETKGYGKVVTSGKPIDRGSLKGETAAYVPGKFTDKRENKEGATLTGESLAKNIASAFGINVELVDSLESEVRDSDGNVVLDEQGMPLIRQDNGMFIPATNTLVINANADATRTVTQTAVHELTHHIAVYAPEEYLKLSRYIMDAWYRKDVAGFNRAIKARQAAYKAQKNQTLSDEQALEEIIADGSADFDWADEDFIAEVTTKEPTLASKIIDAIKNVLQRLRSILASGDLIDDVSREALYDKVVEFDTVRSMWVKAAQTARKAQADQAIDEWQDEANRYSATEGKKSNSAAAKYERGEKLSHSKFNSFYSAHKLNFGRADESNMAEVIENIKTNGFISTTAISNVLPASINDYIDPNRMNDTQARYGARKGDTVMFVPNKYVDLKTDIIKNGFKPRDYEIVEVERDYQPYYELYSKAYDANQPINETARQSLNTEGIEELDDGTTARYSLTSWNETNKDKKLKALVAAGHSEEASRAWIDDINSIASIILGDQERLDYEADRSNRFLKPNGDYYKYTLDASTLCDKRRIYQGTYNAIQHAMPDAPLLQEDVVRIRTLLKDYDHKAPCGICYVESQRKNLGQYAKEWYDNYARKDEIKLADVTTSDGLKELKKTNPEVASDFEKAMAAKGVSSPKVVKLRTDYREDIMRMRPDTVKYLNDIGGLRFHSFSDFETPHLIDTMQAVMDMSAKGLKGMAYAKVPNFAAVFGPTGIKINLSLIAKTDENGNAVHDENGRLVFDSVEGIPYEEASKWRDAYPDNVAFILVGKDKEHTLEAINDDRVDFVIPFHRSKWSAEDMRRLGLIGYEDFATGHQENGIFVSQYWNYEKTGKENAEAYLELCAKEGVAPVFEQLLKDNGDGTYSLQEDGSTDNYWKLLVEGKMYNHKTKIGAPQKVVLPNFNMEEARRVLNEYEGGANELPVADDVVEAFVKEYKESHPDVNIANVRYSIAAELDEPYMDAVNSNDMEKAQRLVDEAAILAGFATDVYHGTRDFGFTQIKTSDLESKSDGGYYEWSPFFATDSIDTAQTYSSTYDIRRINKAAEPFDEDKFIDDYNEAVEKIVTEINGFAQTYNYMDYTMNPFNEAFDKLVNSSWSANDVYEELSDTVAETISEIAWMRANDEAEANPDENKDVDEYADEIQDGDEANAVWEAFGAVADMLKTYDENMYGDASYGNYALKANLDNMMRIDAKGSKWSGIPASALTDVTGEEQSLVDFVNTRQAAAYARDHGYDGIQIDNLFDDGGKGNRQYRPSTIYIFFKPESQVKSSDPVTYAEDGSVIPLSERFDPSNKDVRYSLPTVDSDGNILTDGQMEYFKNSQARDEQGRLVPVYHATNEGGFTIFDPMRSDDHRSLFFSNSADVAFTYAEVKAWDNQFSGDNFSDEAKPGYYACYLNLTNPMIIDANGQNWDSIALESGVPNDLHLEIYSADYLEKSAKHQDTMYKMGQAHRDGSESRKQAKEARKTDSYVLRTERRDILYVPMDEEEMANVINEYYGFDEDSILGYQTAVYLTTLNSDFSKIGHAWANANNIKNLVDDGGMDTRAWAAQAQAEGYDGLIIRNVVDISDESDFVGSDLESDVYVAFSSNQVKDINNEDPSENPDIRYSLPPENDVKDHAAQAAESITDIPLSDPSLEQNRQNTIAAAEAFEASISESWGRRNLNLERREKTPLKNQLIGLMKQVRKGSDTERQYKSETLDATVNAIENMYGYAKANNAQAFAREAWNAAERIVDDIDYNDELYIKYEGMRDYFAKTNMAIPEDMIYDSDFADFVRDNYGRMRFFEEGEDIEDVYKRLAKKYPELFPSKMEDPIDMVIQMDYVLSYIEPYKDAYTSDEHSKLVEDIANNLCDIVSEGQEYRATLNEMNVQAMKQRHEEAVRKIQLQRDRQKERAEKWKQKYEGRIQKDVADRKEKSEKKEHKKHFTRIMKNYKTLCDWVLKPTKEKNVPEEFRKSLAELLQTLDLQTENSKALEEKTGHVASKTLKMRELKDHLKDLAESRTTDEGDYISGGFQIDAYAANLMDLLAKRYDGKSVDELDAVAIRDIDIVLTTIIKNIQRYKQVKTETKMTELSDIGRRCMEFFRAKLNRDGEYRKRKGLRGTLAEINATALTPAYLFDRLGPLKEMYDVLRHNGFDTYIRNEKMITDRLTEILGSYYKTNKKGQNMPGSIIEEWRDERSAQEIKLSNGKTITMSVAQMMSLRCLVKRGEQATDHMTIGGIVVTPIQTTSKLTAEEKAKKSKVGAAAERTKRAGKNFVEERTKGVDESTQKYVLTYEDMQTILSKLTPEQAKIADQLQELMSVDMAKLGNEAHRELYGYDMFGEDNYFPIKVHGNERATDINNIGDVIEKIKSFGFTKPLTPRASQAIEVDDIFSVVADHCNGMNLYNAYLVPITDFMKVFNYAHTFEDGESLTMKEAIEQAYGKDMLKYILNLMKDINGIKGENRGGLEGIMNKALGKAKRTAVFGNIRVALQQPTAIARALTEIDPKYFTAILHSDSLKGFVPETTTATMEELWKYCPVAQWKAWGYYDTYMGRDIEDVMMNTWSVGDKLLAGYYGQLDNNTWAMIWQAVKAEQAALHKGMDTSSEEFLQMCGRRASEVFDKTQVVDSTFHRSDAMRSKQVAVKLATAFMSEPTLTLNVFRAGLYHASELKKEGKKDEANKVLTKTITVLALQAALVSAAQAFADAWRGKDPGLPWGDDDEDKEKTGYWVRWLHNFVYDFIDQLHLENNMYLVKDITPYINFAISKGADYADSKLEEGGHEIASKSLDIARAIMGWDQDYLYSQNNLVMSSVESTAKGIEQAFKKLEKGDEYVDYNTKEPKSWYDIIQKTSSLFGLLTGIPASTLMRDFKPAWDFIIQKTYAADTGLMDNIANKIGYERSGSSDTESEGSSYSQTADDLPDNLSDEQKQEILKAGEKRAKKKAGEEAESKEQLDYDTMLYNAMKAAAGLEGEEYNKKVYSSVAQGLKGYIADGDYMSIGMMRTVIEEAGGDVAYFDQRVLDETKSAYKKTLGGDLSYEERWDQKAMYRYMMSHGMTQEELSSEILYKSDLAKDMKVAYRIGDNDMIYESMLFLADAGMTETDFERLYENRNRMDLAKYKQNGRYRDRLKSMGTFIWPVSGTITSHFGYRNAPTAGASSNHPAIDIGVPVGTPVAAADGGVVIYAGSNSGYGNSVGIKHDNGMVTYYNHLDSWNVNVGDTVAQGQTIAASGNTGISTGPHLDFKILDANGDPVDPEKYLS